MLSERRGHTWNLRSIVLGPPCWTHWLARMEENGEDEKVEGKKEEVPDGPENSVRYVPDHCCPPQHHSSHPASRRFQVFPQDLAVPQLQSIYNRAYGVHGFFRLLQHDDCPHGIGHLCLSDNDDNCAHCRWK